MDIKKMLNSPLSLIGIGLVMSSEVGLPRYITMLQPLAEVAPVFVVVGVGWLLKAKLMGR